jgi:hypothetical protein
MYNHHLTFALLSMRRREICMKPFWRQTVFLSIPALQTFGVNLAAEMKSKPRLLHCRLARPTFTRLSE